jgi:hypothetical protein
MELWDIAGWVLAIAAVGVALYFRFTGRAGGDFYTDLQKATQAARDAVSAAEQLWTTGQIAADERFDWAYAQLNPLFPGLTKEALAMTIEAAVFWLKTSGLAQRLQDASVLRGTGDGRVVPLGEPGVTVVETDGPVLVVEDGKEVLLTETPALIVEGYRPEAL